MEHTQDIVPETPSFIRRRRRRPFLAPLWLSAIAGILVLGAAFTYWNSATSTVVVVIRHAEKQVGSIPDAPLSPSGEVRAARLAQMLGDGAAIGSIRRIFVTDTRRTQQTAAGVAQRLGLIPEILPAATSARELARRVLREGRGGATLIVGHSNTVPEIVAALTGRKDVPGMGEEEFDTVYVVTVPTLGRATVLRLKY